MEEAVVLPCAQVPHPWIWRANCTMILYKGLEHPRIWVSIGGHGTNPPRIPRNNCNFELWNTAGGRGPREVKGSLKAPALGEEGQGRKGG